MMVLTSATYGKVTAVKRSDGSFLSIKTEAVCELQEGGAGFYFTSACDRRDQHKRFLSYR